VRKLVRFFLFFHDSSGLWTTYSQPGLRAVIRVVRSKGPW